MNNNPIYLVDDDADDEAIIVEVLREIGVTNDVVLFTTGEKLLRELRTNPVVPFLIISDINLPGMNGFDLRRKILRESSIIDKTIPFIFWTTSASENQVKEAYDLSAHGFFLKGTNFTDIKHSMEKIIEYWSSSLAPQ
jgi:CheY-like chemotaxis protein